MGKIVLNEELFGIGVEANPTLAGTEESLTSIQIGDTKYKITSSSGIPATGITLFKNGEFYNQNLMTFNISNYVIEDDCIKVTGSGVNGFASNTSTISGAYILVAKFNMPEGTPYGQSGRSTLGANVYDVVVSGTGRISYFNYSTTSNKISLSIIRADNGEGVFMSCGDKTAYIEELAVYPYEEVHIAA